MPPTPESKLGLGEGSFADFGCQGCEKSKTRMCMTFGVDMMGLRQIIMIGIKGLDFEFQRVPSWHDGLV